jgi:ribosomal protein S18 acetylase RimI-like enzyme
MLVRKAKTDDAKQCLEIFKSDDGKYWEDSDFRNSVQHDDVIFLVAEENGVIIGYVLGFILPTKRSEALIHETRVHREERRNGIGTMLVDAFCEEAFSKGAKVVLAEIAPAHLKFYGESCGFKKTNEWIEVARRKD